MSGNSEEFHHHILALGLMSATAQKSTNWECVPTTNCATEMGHFIVRMSEMVRAAFHPHHLQHDTSGVTRDMQHCGMLSNMC